MSYFFVKKYLLVGASGMLWTGESVSGSWVSERCMYATPIRLDLPIKFPVVKANDNNVRRFDPNTVENGHIYSSIKEEEVFIHWAHSTFSVGK